MLNSNQPNVCLLGNDSSYLLLSTDNTLKMLPNGFDEENRTICILQQPETTQVPGESRHFSLHELDQDTSTYLKLDAFSLNKNTSEIIRDNNMVANIFTDVQDQPKQAESPVKLASKPETNQYLCFHCDSHFNTLSNYQDHLKWHKCQKKFKCPQCSAGYNVENNLKIHMLLNHPSDENTSCPICNVTLTYRRAAGMKSHLMIHQVEEMYSCDKCHLEFEREDEYVKHLKSHDNKQKPTLPFTCSYCKVQFENQKEYRSHISEHQKARRYFMKPRKARKSCPPRDKQFICSVCRKSFIKMSLLERHQRIHSGEKPFKCDKCDQSFAQKGTLQIHSIKHTGEKPFSCTMCPSKFSQKGNLKVHIRKTHTFPTEGEKMYKCSHCSCIFKKISSLNGHVTKVHLNQTGAVEDVIFDVMKKLKQLDEQTNKTSVPSSTGHEQSSEKYSENENVVSTLVDGSSNKEESFITLTESTSDGHVKKYVVQHKRVGDVRWYCCGYCPKQCKKPSDLIRHIRVHTKEKPFRCKQCMKAFTLKSTLISHMNTHKSNRSFKCPKCDSVFSSNRVLNSHIRKHDYDNLTKWMCNTCNCLFDDFETALAHKMEEKQPHVIQSVLNNVIKQPLYQTVYGNLTFKPPKPRVPNTGAESSLVRPFHCNICDARFTRKVNLNRHIRYHAGDRKYKCHLCPKTFITSYRLKEHLNYHNNIKKYGCKVCNKRFVTSTLLKRHMIIHNTTKPYMCPYCSKHFKTLLLSRNHIRLVHKKDIPLKFLENDVNNLIPSESSCNGASQEISQDYNEMGTSIVAYNEENTSLKVGSESFLIENGITSESITNDIIDYKCVSTQKDGEYQTFYVNLSDLQLLDNSNLSELNPSLQQMKLQNTENLLIENTQVDNGVIIDSNSLNDMLSASKSTKPLKEGTTLLNNSVYPINSMTLSINGSEAIFDGNTVFQSSDFNETRNIFDDADIICMNCSGVFSSFVTFQKHTCEKKVTQNVESNLTTTKPESDDNVKSEPEKLSKDTPHEKRKPNECHICKKILSNKFALRRHVKHHSIQPNFECGTCKVVVHGKTAYLKHISSHSGSDKCHTCKFCSKNFKKASDLERHLRTHTGEKPFGCDICDKKFSLKSTLLSHIRTHDPNHKEFNCDICNSFYSSKASLRVHMSVHTGQKPHSCRFCKMKFRTIGNRKSHEALKHSSTKKKSDSEPKNKITDVLKSVASEMAVLDCPCSTETQADNVTNQSSIKENNGTLNPPLNMSSQIISLDVVPEGLLPAVVDDQVTIDPDLLFQHIEMSDIVLTSDKHDGEVPSLILDEVNLLDLNATSNSLQIISLPQAGVDNGVTISISEVVGPLEKTNSAKCDICNKLYSSKDVLRRHKKNVHGETCQLSCWKCNKKFKSEASLAKHCKTHPEFKLFAENPEENIKWVQQQDSEMTEPNSSLLNMKFDLPSISISDPVFNSLFSMKKV